MNCQDLLDAVAVLRKEKIRYRSTEWPLYIKSGNGFLTIAPLLYCFTNQDGRQFKEFINSGVYVSGISIPCDGPTFEGYLPPRMLKLIELVAKSEHEVSTDETGTQLRLTSDRFHYGLQLFPVCGLVQFSIKSINNSRQHKEANEVKTTNNYFSDLNAAIELGIFPKGSKPKKAALYAAIASHAAVETVAVEPVAPVAEISDTAVQAFRDRLIASQSVTPTVTKSPVRRAVATEIEAIAPVETVAPVAEVAEVAPVETVAPTATAVSFADLRKQWEAKKLEKSQPKAPKAPKAPKERVKPANYGSSGKSLDRNEVWPMDKIRAIGAHTQTGRVLIKMFTDKSIAKASHESLELTAQQFTQAIGSISEAGYGIRTNPDGSFSVILAEGMHFPKIK